MGVAQNLLSAGSTASGYDAKKNITLANGEAAKNKAYSAAAGAELAARANALVEGANMMTMRGNQRRAEGAYRAAAGGGGFTGEGTGRAAVDVVSGLYEKQISDMAYSSSTGSMNAVNKAIGLRRQGDEYERAAVAEADQFRRMARGTRAGMWFSGLGAAAGGIQGGLDSLQGAQKWNAAADASNSKFANEIELGTAEAVKKQNLTGSSMMGAFSGMDWGSSAMNSVNPFMSSFVSKGWEGNFLKSMGYAKK